MRVHLLDENMQPFDSKELGGLLSILLSIPMSMARWAPRQDWLADFQSGAENRCVVLASTAPTPGTPAPPIIDAMAAGDMSCCLRLYASRNEFSASTGKPASRASRLD